MEAAVARRPRVLTEIDPHSEWVHAREFDALVVDVTGFSKDQLKVQVEPSGSLKVSGERAVDGGGGRQWCHFTKRFDLPAGCCDVDDNVAAITVQLDKGMLYIQVPRRQSAAWRGTEQQPAEAEVYEDALRLRGESDETSDDGHGWNIGRVAAARRDGEHHHPLRLLARGVSRHRQVVLNVVLAVVLLWLVVFAKND
ncbi:16.6 kDa heat shock protein-like [Miscanthus floridulus]|uniref:16.6 kDa heat shock protein-like n=1 Tax=Miscanthus floridulus TaxID=154761 RepID=UPI00345A9AB8